MKSRAKRNSTNGFRFRFTSSVISLTLLSIFASAFAIGCGGGGGGNGGSGPPLGCNPPIVPAGNAALATLVGSVKSTSGVAVQGAGITVVVPGGTNITSTTNCAGGFTITNIPLNATSIQVSSPNVHTYYNYANYKGILYDLIYCALPLPTLAAGNNAPFTEIDLYPSGSNPPPPPPASGCPA